MWQFEHFAKACFPTFRTPESAVAAFAFMVDWVHNQALLLETPPAQSSYTSPDVPSARHIIESALAEGRNALTLPEAKAVLASFQTTAEHVAEVLERVERVLSRR